MTHSSAPRVLLATGLQSSGSSLLSWCFLQRADMNGTLDGDTDLIPWPPEGLDSPLIWYKTTISSFSLQDQLETLEDLGFQVMPLLLARDVRWVWASLQTKPYGRNGITAEDPPLRLRFRRFLRSWEYARAKAIPVLRFEDFIRQPEAELQHLCEQLELPWDQAMLEWPKPLDAIADARHGNQRFRRTVGTSLLDSIDPRSLEFPAHPIPEQDLAWLDQCFADYNRALGYPPTLPDVPTRPGQARPEWAVSRRLQWRLRQKFWRYLFSKLGMSRYRPRPQ